MTRTAIFLPVILTLAAKPVTAQLIPTHRIPAPLASEAVATAVATCANQGYSESAALVDADGVVQAMLRGDGAGIHTLENARTKAFTSASYKSDQSALVARAKAGPTSPALTRLPGLI